jgi:hypothetical protein
MIISNQDNFISWDPFVEWYYFPKDLTVTTHKHGGSELHINI